MRLIDALRITKSKYETGEPLPFDITFSTCNRTHKTGGVMIEMKGVIRTGLPYSMKDNFSIGITQPGNSDRPITVHCRLITQINQEQISY